MGEGPAKGGHFDDADAYLAGLGLDEAARAELKKASDDALRGAEEEMKRRAADPYAGLRSGMPDPEE